EAEHVLQMRTRSLMTKGSFSCAYSTALASGKPFEWKEMRQSQAGHSSTGFVRMTCSGKTTVLMYSNSCRRVRISTMGRDSDFLAMAHTPSSTCFDSPIESESSSEVAIRLRL